MFSCILLVVLAALVIRPTSPQIHAQVINQAPPDQLQPTSLKPPEIELVDQIESIEVTSTQVVIITSRAGPPETMKVSIAVVDIETGVELPPTNLTGILLILTRGRYTVSFLTPNRWYGILFRCEQQYGGPSGTIYVNEEEHLVKTHKEDGSNLDAQPLVSVTAKRFGSGGRSLENLIVTVKWEQHPDERDNLDTLTNITLFCKEQIKYKQLRLYGRELEKSVEVKLDNHFEIMEFYNNSRQIIASITPKNCPRICWNAELVAETAQGFHFRRAATHSCEEIEPVSATTNLRDYLSYEAHPNKLIVHTNYSDNDHKEKEADAYIQVTAIPLPEPKSQIDNATIRFKTFSTSKADNDFILDHLEPNKMYAIQYTYGKQSPFAYAESRRFIIETRNSASPPIHSPVKIHFEQPPHLTIESESEGNATHGNISHLFHHEPILPPKVIMRLDPHFKNYEVGVDMEPFCNPTAGNGSHFWLNKDKMSRELRDVNVLEAICDETPSSHLCNQTPSAHKKRCSLSPPELCYTANIMVQEKVYSMDRRCLDIAKQYHPTPAPVHTPPSPTPTGNGAVHLHSLISPLCVSLFVVTHFARSHRV